MFRLLSLLPLVLACAGAGSGPEAPPSAPPERSSAPASEGAEAVIRAVYAPYLSGGDAPSPLTTPERLTPGLAALVSAERTRTEADGVGALDFDVAIDAQDDHLTDLHLATTGDESTATVVATFQNFDQSTTVTWSLVRVGSAWVIDDVRFSDGRTLRRLLGG